MLALMAAVVAGVAAMERRSGTGRSLLERR